MLIATAQIRFKESFCFVVLVEFVIVGIVVLAFSFHICTNTDEMHESVMCVLIISVYVSAKLITHLDYRFNYVNST